jgi:hypothetical protein
LTAVPAVAKIQTLINPLALGRGVGADEAVAFGSATCPADRREEMSGRGGRVVSESDREWLTV